MPLELYLQVKEDTLEECNSIGKVISVVVPCKVCMCVDMFVCHLSCLPPLT